MQAELAGDPRRGGLAATAAAPHQIGECSSHECFEEATVDTRPKERDEAVAETPIGRGHAPSTLDLGTELAVDDDRRRRNLEPEPTTNLPQT